MLRFIELTCGYVPVVMQQSMEVPQTPLHTSRVLKEEKDVWEEVKVIFFSHYRAVLVINGSIFN